MIIKQRCESKELKLLRSCNVRMNLSGKDANYLLKLEKGFKGEQMFDKWLTTLSDGWLVLNDLLLEYNNIIFQIDSLLLSNEKINLFEVKNYDSDYFLDGNRWFSSSGAEIQNPLIQLTRTESLLRRLLHDLGFDYPIESHLVFINPDFYLYQAPLKLPAIFLPQMSRFFNKLNDKQSPKINNKLSNLAQKLASLHLQSTPFKRIYQYTPDQFKKGFFCKLCSSFAVYLEKDILICKDCGCKEDIESAVMRIVEEYKILYPNQQITTKAIYDWCKIIRSQKTIRRILGKNFKHIFNGRGSFYE